MKKFIEIIILSILICANSYAQQFEKAEKISGTKSEYITNIKTDKQGNVYVCGYYQSSIINFNNNKQLKFESMGPNLSEIFIAKYDNKGLCRWVERIASGNANNSNGTFLNAFEVDDLGNIYIAGSFLIWDIYFNNGRSIKSAGEVDGFLAKYNSDGICQWAKGIGGERTDYVNSIALDKSGNVSLVGYSISDKIDFGNYKTLTQYKTKLIFVAKYNNSGACLWAKKIYGNEFIRNFNAYDVFADNNGNIFLLGEYQGESLYFENDAYLDESVAYDYDIFFARYNKDGYCVWAQKITGYAGDYGMHIFTDNVNNLYVTGFTNSESLEFSNNITLKNTGGITNFLSKYDMTAKCQWVQQMVVGANSNCIYDLKMDDNGFIYTCGSFNSDVLNFNNGISLKKYSGDDGYFAIYNNAGKCLSANLIAGNKSESIFSLALDSNDYIYLAGRFGSDTLDLKNNVVLTNSGDFDAFFARYRLDKSVSVDDNNTANFDFNVFPNPTNDYIDIEIESSIEQSILKIYNIEGIEIADLTSELLYHNGSLIRYNTSPLPIGSYNIILSNKGSQVIKQVIIRR